MKTIKDIENYSVLLAARAFVYLLSADCIEVDFLNNHTFRHRYQYKTKPGIDRELVKLREAAVLNAAEEMQVLTDILELAGAHIRANEPETDRPVDKSDRLVLRSIRKVVNDALAYQPPVSLCSV